VTLNDGKKEELTFTNAIIATGAKYKTFPGLEHDGKRLIGAWEALKVDKLPKSIGIIGAGAIGVEFAYFWNAFGVEVSIFEMQKNLLPIEDTDSSLEIEKAYKKQGIKLHLGVEKISAKNNGNDVTFTVTENGKTVDHKFEMGLIAVGMTGNVEGFGLDKIGVQTEKGFIKVNNMFETSVKGIYAIGDVSGPPLLAHAASHEGVVAAEHLCGKHPHPMDKMNIPGCTYCQPQVASVGYTERALKEKGIEYKVGKAPFMANGKAIASNENHGFIKVLTGKHGELLGAHIVGTHATELIHEYVLFRTMEGIDEEIFATVHPHPTLGEFLGEAVLAAKGRALNL
jgi:dihydrolipoamide dehydrogenase